MATSDIGRLITTATKNIYYEWELTAQERSVASSIAPLIRQSKRNWIPIYVREISTHKYQLIGNPIVLEATKLAEQKVIHCIQLDDASETENHILKSQEILLNRDDGKTPTTTVDMMLLLKKVEELEHKYNEQRERIKQIFDRIVPNQTLAVNQEDKRTLTAKLSLITGMGEKTLTQVVKDILANKPFYSEHEFKASVTAFKPSKSKSRAKIPKNEQLWQALTSQYVLDFSIKS